MRLLDGKMGSAWAWPFLLYYRVLRVNASGAVLGGHQWAVRVAQPFAVLAGVGYNYDRDFYEKETVEWNRSQLTNKR